MPSEEGKLPSVDVVIPVYGERPEAIAATLWACLNQTHRVSAVFVVDDGSSEPVRLPDQMHSSDRIFLLRLSENQGISAARNEGVAHSHSPFLACINAEVLPEPDWLATCLSYLSSHPEVGACYTRLIPEKPARLLTRWRMQFLETKFGAHSGPTPFAPGHAVLFRKEAVLAVGGYDRHYRLHHEDSDICRRMKNAGWETHYIAESRCISIQADSLKQLSKKELRERGWYSPAEGSLARLYYSLSKYTLIRAGRNLVKGRFSLLPVDAAIWATALWTATSSTVRAAIQLELR
jgi:cellulose synthase/poly-beta-1,6-N-acetylglucosamine synthase-like glycosyltransferase